MQAAVDDYHELATDNALCDYSFHVIVTDPSEEQMHVELPRLIEQGITSVKVSCHGIVWRTWKPPADISICRFIRRIQL